MWSWPADNDLTFPVDRALFYYIRTEKYSPKSYVVNFRTQISSSQSEERTMVFTWEKNNTSNQNRERSFFTCEKNDTSNQKPQRCVSFAPRFPPFLKAGSAASHTFNEKSFTRRVFLAKKKGKTFRKWSGIVSFVSLSIKKTLESWRNNSGKGKTERDVSFCCAFCRSYFAVRLSLSLYWNRPFYLNFTHFQLCIENKQLRLLIVLGLPHILSVIYVLNKRFY